jgi:hypothetical protein
VAHILILYKLKDGVTRQDFEHWLENSSAPALRGIKRIKSVQVYRAEKRVMSSGAPSVDYVELFDIPSPALRKDMEEFQGFAQSPEYLVTTALI